jgi:hypothetical protein
MMDRPAGITENGAYHGSGTEHTQRHQEHLTAAEEIGRPAAQKQQTAVAKDVPADYPLQRTGRQVQVRTYVGQRDPDQRQVEAVEEEGSAKDDQQHPGRRFPLDISHRGRDPAGGTGCIRRCSCSG